MNGPSTATQKALFTFAIITDTHIRPPGGDESSPFTVNDLANDRARYAIAAIARHEPAFTIHLGDMVHPLPHLPTYDDAADEAMRIFAPLKDGMHFVPGNHDIGDKPMDGSPARPADQASIKIYEKHFGPGYYSFDHGGIHVVVMNSSLIGSGSNLETHQQLWLEDDLDRHTSDRIILFSHYPPFIDDPNEPLHYDNYNIAGRAWLLDLLRKHDIEAVYSGHVHQFFYNRAGNTKLFCLPATSFIRQDYSELYDVGPTAEYGRNDNGKFSYTLIDVFKDGHRLRIIPTEGRGLAAGNATIKPDPVTAQPLGVPLVVHLRHAWARARDMPYNGAMEEFARKRARNDYVLLRLLQMGISGVRTPLTDLLDPEYGPRVQDFSAVGLHFTFFCAGVATPKTWQACQDNAHLIDTVEFVTSTLDLSDIADQLAAFDATSGPPVHLGKFHSSAHDRQQGSKYAHSVSFGFKWDDRNGLLPCLRKADRNSSISGIVFQVNLTDELSIRLPEIDAWAATSDLTAVAVIRLADANPAIANFDDEAISARISEALSIVKGLQNVTLQLDTFMDIDRGYHPRNGLIDRRSNFRLAGYKLAMQSGR